MRCRSVGGRLTGWSGRRGGDIIFGCDLVIVLVWAFLLLFGAFSFFFLAKGRVLLDGVNGVFRVDNGSGLVI